MAKNLLVVPASREAGLTSVCLGLLRSLQRVGVSVGFYKPFSQSVNRGELEHNGSRDSSVAFARDRSGLEPPDPLSLKEAQRLLNRGQSDLLMERVVGEYQKVASTVDVVIIEALGMDSGEAYIARLNVEIARNLGSEVILLSAPRNRSPQAVDEELDFSARLFASPTESNVVGVILNKVGEPERSEFLRRNDPDQVREAFDYAAQCSSFSQGHFRLLATIPWQPELLAPRASDLVRELKVSVLHEGEIHTRRIQRVTVCARSIRNMIHTLRPGTLLVTPGDREDIVVTVAVAALNGVPLAGLMLTGGMLPDERVRELCRRALDTGLPVLQAHTNTYETAHRLANLSTAIPIDDPERIENAMDTVSSRIDAEWLREHLKVPRQSTLSPPAFRYLVSERARKYHKRIVLPEGNEPRTLQAAATCEERGLAHCVLLGDPVEIEDVAGSLGLTLPDSIEIIDPAQVRSSYVDALIRLRRPKELGSTLAEAMLEDNVVLGTVMVAEDEADGLVSGAVHTTANTVRPALQLIKTHEGARLVSSVFFMLLPQQVLVYGDCAINPDPNAEQLADIAIQSAESAIAFGIEPRVAMISYSTGASGRGQDVDKVREATRIARERRPDLLIDGPLQYDAAAIASVARSKAPDSPVAGRATVFIFPDLNTGNTTYKAVQRSANVVSIGPMLQGLRKPVNDLSRGASVDDIIYTIAITGIQAGQLGG
ncbi:phosphate acetyltransferase [Gilvimarinus sp. F26214L]|uniref:phosphate acetyltransferase n=1 Tax=Gilvimarinus sp. DZF01 TaxID=3461371 RepID=UPI004045579A